MQDGHSCPLDCGKTLPIAKITAIGKDYASGTISGEDSDMNVEATGIAASGREPITGSG